MTLYPVSKRFINVGKETTVGTPAVTYTTIPVNKFDPEDQVTYLVDDAWRASMAGEYGLTQGPWMASTDIGGPVYADTIGHALQNILGDYAVTGVGPYTHTFALKNDGDGQPVTHTLVDGSGIAATGKARRYAASCFSDVKITGDAQKLLAWEGKFTSYVSDIPASAPTASVSSVPAQAAWNSVVNIAGSEVDDIATWEVDIQRVVDPYWTASGAQNPYVLARGDLTVSGTLTFSPAIDESPLLAMLGNTQPELQIVATGPAGTSLTLHCQNAAYDTSKIDSGSSMFGYAVTFKGVANTTDVGASSGYGPIVATLTNSVTTY